MGRRIRRSARSGNLFHGSPRRWPNGGPPPSAGIILGISTTGRRILRALLFDLVCLPRQRRAPGAPANERSAPGTARPPRRGAATRDPPIARDRRSRRHRMRPPRRDANSRSASGRASQTPGGYQPGFPCPARIASSAASRRAPRASPQRLDSRARMGHGARSRSASAPAGTGRTDNGRSRHCPSPPPFTPRRDEAARPPHPSMMRMVQSSPPSRQVRSPTSSMIGHSASATRAKTFTGKLPRQSRTRSAP